MSVDAELEGGFGGTRRQEMIHCRLFTLLSGYDGRYKRRRYVTNNTTDELIFSWLMDVKGWSVLGVLDGWIFVSLARALPDVDFSYDMCLTEMVGAGDQSLANVFYKNGRLSFYSACRTMTDHYEPAYSVECPQCGVTLRLSEEETDEKTCECPACGELIDLNEVIVKEVEGGFNEDSDEDYEKNYEEESDSFDGKVDKDGNIVGDKELEQLCITSENRVFSELLVFTETGADDPRKLIDLGMLYETGLAGIDRNLTKAWDCYLKAAQTGDKKAVEFVTELFSDESRKTLRELLKNKCISKEAYPVFFDIGVRKNDAELNAELLDYKGTLEND